MFFVHLPARSHITVASFTNIQVKVNLWKLDSKRVQEEPHILSGSRRGHTLQNIIWGS